MLDIAMRRGFPAKNREVRPFLRVGPIDATATDDVAQSLKHLWTRRTRLRQ